MVAVLAMVQISPIVMTTTIGAGSNGEKNGAEENHHDEDGSDGHGGAGHSAKDGSDDCDSECERRWLLDMAIVGMMGGHGADADGE